jgi:DNA-binding response OmpR family regulator
MRILIVDDDPDVLDFLKTFFSNLGHEPITSSTAQGGLRSLVTTPPDLVFSIL